MDLTKHWQTHFNKTNATIGEMQDKSHLPWCLHMAVPLSLCVIQGCCLPCQWHDLLGALSCSWVTLNAMWGEAPVGTAPCSSCSLGRMPRHVGCWATGAVSSQTSSWTIVGCDLVVRHKKIVALLFRGSCPGSFDPSCSDLGSGGTPGLQAVPWLSC